MSLLNNLMRFLLKNKKVIFIGPPKSGKTTLNNWFIDGKVTNKYIQSGERIVTKTKKSTPDEFKGAKRAIQYTDMGGSKAWLSNGKLAKDYKKNDVIILVFNIALYFSESRYSHDVNALFDAIHTLTEVSTKGAALIIVGSHKDQLTEENENVNIERFLTSNTRKKWYPIVQNNVPILANLTSKTDVLKIFSKLL